VKVKKIASYSLSISLAALVLLMSIGLSWSNIACADIQPDSCCAAEEPTCCTVEVTDDCCYEEERSLQFDFDTPVAEVQDAPDFLIAFTLALFSFNSEIVANQQPSWAYDLPPPKTVSQQLSILQVYRL
jgi:hypothetical protein